MLSSRDWARTATHSTVGLSKLLPDPKHSAAQGARASTAMGSVTSLLLRGKNNGHPLQSACTCSTNHWQEEKQTGGSLVTCKAILPNTHLGEGISKYPGSAGSEAKRSVRPNLSRPPALSPGLLAPAPTGRSGPDTPAVLGADTRHS